VVVTSMLNGAKSASRTVQTREHLMHEQTERLLLTL
jgi:hypothetical protein